MESPDLSPSSSSAAPNPGMSANGHLPTADSRIRVLVVDDSYFMQRRLAEILHGAPDLRVVGYADNGAEAIRLAEKLSPDVITMDINMSQMDGLQAIDYIMRSNPRPIVIISAYTQKGSRAAFYGLDIGVIDIIEKPSSCGSTSDLLHCTSEIINKVRMAAGVRLASRLHRLSEEGTVPPLDACASERQNQMECALLQNLPDGFPQVIAMGASTGGPTVLQKLLGAVPQEAFPPVVIVQHLPEKFNRELAEHLNAVSSLEVVEAREGQHLTNGTVYIAPGSSYLQINAHGCLTMNEGPRVNYRKPSIDVLFNSLARHHGSQVMAFVLSGMGEDGAVGALAIKRAGGAVIAQDEASSIVFSMPEAAIKAGGVDQVLSVERMERLLLQLGRKAASSASRPPAYNRLLQN
ncbi:chemotaxis-specific protein-glutamate methyltransferase CheB [Pedosphaera parvula]|uniref:Protein-glutamate methylesterase/protein-glutamine glutaminase n=1 Tax=Pedosphaera parvula (strain Ellin514) TaxID=320771 RepID=B9XDM4_PEDPL|nr:chemotaxis-specific protein-glutamate methyltransferase CheB [Pedosphaera parvula]EEF62170.1 response regulator receiver modulated CheB methylesterase [Pedosphaera parvula Ellin514]